MITEDIHNHTNDVAGSNPVITSFIENNPNFSIVIFFLLIGIVFSFIGLNLISCFFEGMALFIFSIDGQLNQS